MLIADIEKNYGKEYYKYLYTPNKRNPIGGESMDALFKRVTSFLDELKGKDYEKVLIVSHGITIKAFNAIIKELTWEEFSNLEVYTGTALNVCQLEHDQFEFLVEGDVSHLL